jgi:hypothetical protein
LKIAWSLEVIAFSPFRIIGTPSSSTLVAKPRKTAETLGCQALSHAGVSQPLVLHRNGLLFLFQSENFQEGNLKTGGWLLQVDTRFAQRACFGLKAREEFGMKF